MCWMRGRSVTCDRGRMGDPTKSLRVALAAPPAVTGANCQNKYSTKSGAVVNADGEQHSGRVVQMGFGGTGTLVRAYSLPNHAAARA